VRNEHPRRFTALSLHFDIAGKDIDAANVERAIRLSRETYCSVFGCFRPDMEAKITYNLTT
jgi:uncharacterized OsmC-like protein